MSWLSDTYASWQLLTWEASVWMGQPMAHSP